MKQPFNIQLKLLNEPKSAKLETDLDFFEVYRRIEQATQRSFLLESLGEYGNEERYSLLGFEPDYQLSAKGNQITCGNQTLSVDNPYFFLRSIFPQSKIKTQIFSGGLVGYLAYDTVNYFENQLQVKIHPDFNQFEFGIYTDGLIYDKETQEITYVYHHHNRLPQIHDFLARKAKPLSIDVTFVSESLTKAEHSQGLSKVLEEVKAGNTFQAQFGFKRHYTFSGDHLAIYQELRQVNPSPYMYYLKSPQHTLMGASPELLFRLNKNQMETFPLAGTVKRGQNPAEDMSLANQLLNDPKEIAEHNMLVDLHRNDIGRVAEFGSVKVRKLKEIKKFSHVQHISSEITGTLKKSEDVFSALASNFPAGTLSGAPKIESIKIIDRVEREPRGPYGGAVGYFGFNQKSAFCIPIRSLFISRDQGFVQASGGIVYDSQAELEYQEIQNKLAGMDKVLRKFQKEI